MDLPTPAEAAEAVKTVGGLAGLIAFAKVVASSAAKWGEHRAAERRARAEAALAEEQAELENAKSLAAAVRDLQWRVKALEQELTAEREARAAAEKRAELAETGKFHALADAEAKLARAATEVSRWERIARDQAQAYEDLVRAVGSGFSQAPPPDRMDELDTIPPRGG